MKAILILNEMPSSCEDCACFHMDVNYSSVDGYYCGVDGHEISKQKISRCHLKPMPERINPLKVDSSNLLDLGYMHGRNDIINEMEGEKE